MGEVLVDAARKQRGCGGKTLGGPGARPMRQNSEFSMWARMYKNTAQATVRLTVDGDRYVANDVLS